MQRTATVEKQIGETPLAALERFRAAAKLPPEVPLAYAGRLDPMASGKLLILIGDECKRQEDYHRLDKRYRVEVLFGTRSDTSDVLGRLESGAAEKRRNAALRGALAEFTGHISLPYPHFSAKTVHGKPLHQWTLEGRLHEIELPVAHTFIYKISLQSIKMIPAEVIYDTARAKIDSFPPVTDAQKALGADFRRREVRADWEQWRHDHANTQVRLMYITVTCSSGTYMRSRAKALGERLGTNALAYSIHRTHIGRFQPLPDRLGGGFFYPQW